MEELQPHDQVETLNKNNNEANTNHAKQMDEFKTKIKEQNTTKKDKNPPGNTPAKLNKTLNPINNLDVTIQQRNKRRPRNRPSLPRIATRGLSKAARNSAGDLEKIDTLCIT